MKIAAPHDAPEAQHSAESQKCENPKRVFFLLTLLFTWMLVDRGEDMTYLQYFKVHLFSQASLLQTRLTAEIATGITTEYA